MGSHLTTRPAATGYGASVTCYQNDFTAYTAVGSALSAECNEIEFRFMDGATSTAAKDTVVRIGIDTAGGTSFTALGDFLIGPSSAYNLGGSRTTIWLPITIPAGATIGVVGSVNNATPGTLRCSWRASGGGAGAFVRGTAVESVGLTLASSSGTSVTPGQAAEGTWTSLGTLTNAAKYMGCGCTINNGGMVSTVYHIDLSYSTDAGVTKNILVEDQIVFEASSEAIAFESVCKMLAFRDIPAGAVIYGRAQCAAAPTAGFSMAAWAVR